MKIEDNMKSRMKVLIGLFVAFIAIMIPIISVKTEAAEREQPILIVNEDNVEGSIDIEVTTPVTVYSKYYFEEFSGGSANVFRVVNDEYIDEITGELSGYESEIPMGGLIAETLDLYPGKYRIYAGVYDDYGSEIEVYTKKCEKVVFTYDKGDYYGIGSEFSLYRELYGLDIVEYSSSNEKIAKVSSEGDFILAEPGKVSITCKTSDYTIIFEYGAQKPYITRSKVDIVKGYTWNAGYDICGLPLNTKLSDVRWSTSNSKIATVDKKGVVKGKKIGTVTIKCRVDKYTISAKVKVVENKYKKTEKIDLSLLDPSESPVYGQVREMQYNSKGGLDVKFAIMNVSNSDLKKVDKLSITLYYRDKNYSEKVLTKASFSNLKGVKKQGYTVYNLTIDKKKIKKQGVNLRDDTFWGSVSWDYNGTW